MQSADGQWLSTMASECGEEYGHRTPADSSAAVVERLLFERGDVSDRNPGYELFLPIGQQIALREGEVTESCSPQTTQQ